MQISLLAIIQILGVTHCQQTADNSASEIVAKFRDLLYDETTLSPDYEDPSSAADEDSTDPAVTTPITTPSPPPASSTSPVTTTEASLENVNLSEDDLEINDNEVQSALEPRQLGQDLKTTAAKANRVTFPETKAIEVISNPLPDISALVPDVLEEIAESTEEAIIDFLDEVSPELEDIGNSETSQMTNNIDNAETGQAANNGDSETGYVENIADSETGHGVDTETGHKAMSSGKWFYYSGHPGLVPHYWPSIQKMEGESEETNEVEDKVKVMAYPYHHPYYHPRRYSGYHHPYVYFYRSTTGQV